MHRGLSVAIVLSVSVWSLSAAGPTFRPDAVFRGSSLNGWTVLGDAEWRAQNGEIVGVPKQPSGGWLVLEKSFQDVAFFANVTCTGGCKTGVLLRAEKTDAGMKGVYVSLTEGDLVSYAVQLDARGNESSRTALQPAGRGGGGGGGGQGAARGAGGAAAAPGGATGAAPGAAQGGGRGRGGAPPPQLPAGVSLPGVARPTGAYLPGKSNSVDITLAKTVATVRFNGGSLGAAGGLAPDEAGKYGRVALYVGGTGEVRFKDVAYSDLNARPFEAEKVSSNFRMQRINEFFYSYSSAIADVNRDGHPDVVAGPYYYLGPAFTVGREIYAGVTYNPTSEWPLASMLQLAHDFTGDGWPDVLNMSGNAGNGTGTLYVNPKGEQRRWDSFVVMQPPDGVVGNEETLLKDVDGDGKPEIIHTGQNTMRYSKPDPANPTGPWQVTTISEPGPWGVNISHGMGIGDIDGDGLMDYATAYGWWQQPPKGSGQKLWTYHPAELARWGASQGGAGGAEMGIYDVNGDKLNDIVTTLEGHGFGLAWHEQKRGADGRISFVRHTIMDGFLDTNAGGVTFTQPHASAFADIDRDGILDLIVGKRHHSHFQYADPDNWGPPVLYVYKVVRQPKAPGGAEFVPELIHNRSGVGSHMDVGDLNKDGTIDIVTSGPSGTYVFFNQTKRGKR